MKNVAAALFIQGGSILITKRGRDQKLAGLWEFPGGKQEIGETIYECLEREILEELGVRCKANNIYLETKYNYDSGSINLVAINSDLIDSQIELKVHDEFKWVDIRDLNKYSFAPADIKVVEKIIDEYGKNN